MIVWSKHHKCYIVLRRSPRRFEDKTYEEAADFPGYVMFYGGSHASPSDKKVVQNGSTGMDLCHHISFGAIEVGICEFLNGEITPAQFLHYTALAVTPTWLSLSLPQASLSFIQQWSSACLQRFSVTWARLSDQSKDDQAEAANMLVKSLNNAKVNLRYGDSSTNRSIQGHVDARIGRGFTLEPVGIVERCWSYATGNLVYAPETSTALQTMSSDVLGSRATVRSTGNNVLMSEEGSRVGVTKSSNRPLMGAKDPAVSILRGPVPIIGAYSPVNRDTLLNMFAIVFLATFLASYFGISFKLW